MWNYMPIIWSPDTYSEALIYAATAHEDQKVPGRPYSYVVHITSVAMEVIAAFAFETVDDPDLAVQCALLHDVIEDTRLSYDDVEKNFGKAVADGVLALSKDPSLPKSDQIPDSLRRIRRQPKEVQMVKLCDRISNMREPPEEWTTEKRKSYRADAKRILDELRESSSYLAARLEKKIAGYSEFVL